MRKSFTPVEAAIVAALGVAVAAIWGAVIYRLVQMAAATPVLWP